jgi:hypothetical protein
MDDDDLIARIAVELWRLMYEQDRPVAEVAELLGG